MMIKLTTIIFNVLSRKSKAKHTYKIRVNGKTEKHCMYMYFMKGEKVVFITGSHVTSYNTDQNVKWCVYW